jgi:PTS system galactitol-specific IIB component
MKKVIVACGSGIATSHMVAKKIKGLLASRGIDADVSAADMSDLDDVLADADAFVPVVNTDQTYDVPTFSGVAFLTGINQDEELDRLVAALS